MSSDGKLALEYDYDDLMDFVDNDPERLWDDEVIDALAISLNKNSKLWARFSGQLSGIESINANTYKKHISGKADELKNGSNGGDEGPEAKSNEEVLAEIREDLPEIPEPEVQTTWADVRDVIVEEFDQKTLEACEALATVPIQLMFPDFTDCPMVVLVGNPSSGKTTSLELFRGWDRIAVRHEVSPAAFVSHNVDQDESDLGEMDLLPKITEQVLWVPEMGTWFTGENVGRHMRTLAGVADGSGYVRSTGAQGTHGYDGNPGDYQFGMMGATVPPSPSAWKAMGNAGARILFHHMPNEEDRDTIKRQMFGDGTRSYSGKILHVRHTITQWLRTLWHEYDGEVEMKPEDKESEVSDCLINLAQIIATGRAVSYAKSTDGDTLDAEVQKEDPKRAIQMLRFTARARALMDGRKSVKTDDLAVCARIAFASMPEERREITKLLLDPRNGMSFTTSDVKSELDLGSKHTAKQRMQLMHRLGFATYETEGESVRGGKADVVRLNDRWETVQWMFSKESEEDNPGPLAWPFD